MLRRALGWAATLAGVLAVTAFLVGRVASDRWQATQYLHWMPGVATVLGVLVMLGVSRLAWARSKGIRRVRGVGVVLLGLAGAWVLVLEWRVYNVVMGGAARSGATFTIVHFNASGKPAPALPGGVLTLEPDLVVFANLRARDSLPVTREAMSTPGGSGASVVHADRFTAVSRLPIVAIGHTTLGFEGAIFMNRDLPDLRDPGTAAWFRLASTEALGRELVVWTIDLPSDPRLARREVMSRSMSVIEAWSGPTYVREEGGNYAIVAHAAGQSVGFPAPDVVIGDFNTPGGSYAIREFARRAGGAVKLIDAHAAAGVGPDGTFPGFAPRWLGWGIDRALVSERLGVVQRDVRAVGLSQHRAQRVIISPAPPSAAPAK